MGFGSAALVIASQVTMIPILLALACRAVRMVEREQLYRAAARHEMALMIAIFAGAMIVQQVYYIAARLLLPHGINLWQLHPGPEAMNLVVAMGAYGLMVPFILARAGSARAGLRLIATEWTALLALWVAIAWALF